METSPLTSSNSIHISQIYKEMGRVDRKGRLKPFSITGVTCDLERNTGGERISVKGILNNAGSKSHRAGKLIVVRLFNSDAIRAFHPILTTRINGKEVYL